MTLKVFNTKGDYFILSLLFTFCSNCNSKSVMELLQVRNFYKSGTSKKRITKIEREERERDEDREREREREKGRQRESYILRMNEEQSKNAA